MKLKSSDMLLYAVTDRRWTGRQTLYEQVEEALKGGATFVQLREKNPESREALLKEAAALKDLCHRYHVPFVVDDAVGAAVEAGADGVHVGQSDMEAGAVRAVIGPDKILGVSAQTVEQAVLAEQRGADYLGVGAVFPTDSKADAAEVSLETLKAICSAVSIPVVAIGGVSCSNVSSLKGTGIDGVAVISAIFGQEDIKNAASELKEAVRAVTDTARKNK